MQLSERCPNLHTFLLDNPRDQISTLGLLSFLKSTPSISDFCSYSGLQDIFTEETWFHFAKRPLLQRFSLLSNTLTQIVSKNIRELISHPFQSLTSLECRADTAGLTPLLPFLSNLQSLEVQFADPSTSIFSTIASRCPSLKRLAVEYGSNSQCDGTELLAVAKGCKDLRSFNIMLNVPEYQSISDSDIETFTKALPALKKFELIVSTGLSVLSLLSLGRNCRILEVFVIRGAFRLRELENEIENGPLFPKLRDMGVMNGIGLDSDTVNDFARVLKFHAPVLEYFDSGGGPRSFDNNVMLALADL